MERCRRAEEHIYAIAVAHAIHESHPLQRTHRDIHTASPHAIADLDAAAELKGKLELGLTEGMGLV